MKGGWTDKEVINQGKLKYYKHRDVWALAILS